MEDTNNGKVRFEARNIDKYFGGVCALKDVSFKLYEGEVLGLVGDNGAGKSTLIKIISGLIKKDNGDIYVDGEKVEINSPNDAKKLNIETVYQDLALVNGLNVPANIFLGRELTIGGLIGKFFGLLDFKRMYKASLKLIKELEININDLFSTTMNLSGGQRQAIALGKVVFWGKKIVLLDEPTAALGVRESKNALELISRLKKHNISVIVISHNLQHIFSVVDRIMVLRRGQVVGIKNAHETTADEIVCVITGTKVIATV